MGLHKAAFYLSAVYTHNAVTNYSSQKTLPVSDRIYWGLFPPPPLPCRWVTDDSEDFFFLQKPDLFIRVLKTIYPGRKEASALKRIL